MQRPRLLLATAVLLATAAAGLEGAGCSDAVPAATEAPPYVAIEPADVGMIVGATRTLSAFLYEPVSSTTARLPDGGAPPPTRRQLRFGVDPMQWASSDSAVATIEAASGTARALTAGTTTIRVATRFDGGALNAAATLVVTAPHTLSALTVEPATATIDGGESLQYKAVGRFLDRTTEDVTARVTWSTSAPTVAVIPVTGGLARGFSGGTAKIIASWGAVSSEPALLTVVGRAPDLPDSGFPSDSGTPDAGAPDSGAEDGGAPDGGEPDSGSADSSASDSGSTEDADADAGPADATAD